MRDPAAGASTAGVSGGSPKGCPSVGWFAAARMQLGLLQTERGPESSPATAALALAASKSGAIRWNSRKVGKKWMYTPAPPCNEAGKGREAMPWCPGVATLVSDLSSLLPGIAHGTHLLLPCTKL